VPASRGAFSSAIAQPRTVGFLHAAELRRS
jgi:hypothetical protein